MRVYQALRVLSCAVGILVAGCKIDVPIHVWQPAELESTVGRQVVVPPIVGPEELADQIQTKLMATAPTDRGRQTTLVDTGSLQDKTPIQLVSATDDQPNDLALASAARREGISYLLRGEVIEAQAAEAENPSLKVSWNLTSLSNHNAPGGKPVVIDLKSAIEQYPDLALINDQDEVLAAAIARQTHRLITPYVDREQTQLSVPFLFPGSLDVRRGIAAAHAGRWGEAEKIWLEVVEKHPGQVAATHNLALAAAAAQDFSRAKQLARLAIRWRPTELHKQTLVWIERKQRDYHQAFCLPDPPEGWFLTRDKPR